MDKEDLDFFRNLVAEKLSRTSDDIESIENIARNNGKEMTSEDRSTYSLHMADHGTDAMEKEKSQLLANAAVIISNICTKLNSALKGAHSGSAVFVKVRLVVRAWRQYRRPPSVSVANRSATRSQTSIELPLAHTVDRRRRPSE